MMIGNRIARAAPQLFSGGVGAGMTPVSGDGGGFLGRLMGRIPPPMSGAPGGPLPPPPPPDVGAPGIGAGIGHLLGGMSPGGPGNVPDQSPPGLSGMLGRIGAAPGAAPSPPPMGIGGPPGMGGGGSIAALLAALRGMQPGGGSPITRAPVAPPPGRRVMALTGGR
jgi:hypothetical protein